MEPRSTRNVKIKTPKSKRKVLLISLSAVLAVAIGIVIYWAIGVINAINDFNPSSDDNIFPSVPPEEVVEVPKWEGKERVNILLMGVDARDAQPGETARSDSMMVASIDPVTKKAHLFSILRDTYGLVEGHGQDRINAAVTYGGPPLAMKTVGDMMGLEIQYYVYTDFEGFKALIDTMGGIYFDVEKNMRYRDNADGNRYDINLEKGYQKLDGDKALQYVRFRHDKMSDFTRTERQRNFMMAVAKEMKSTWNIINLPEILQSLKPYVHMNLDFFDLVKLATLGFDLKISGSAQLPPMNLVIEKKVNGADVIGIRDENKLREYVQEVLSADEGLEEGSEDNQTETQQGTDATGTTPLASPTPSSASH